jgi:hypothetical protein
MGMMESTSAMLSSSSKAIAVAIADQLFALAAYHPTQAFSDLRPGRESFF